MNRILAFRLLLPLFQILRALFRTRTELAIENIALRQQLAVLKRAHPRPRLSTPDNVWFAVLHGSRKIVHFNVTEYPCDDWVIFQIKEAFLFGMDPPPRHLIYDRDSTFSDHVTTWVKWLGMDPVRTSYRSPWQNPIAERWVGSVRRELLDHVVVLGPDHLRRLLRAYLDYFHEDRTHLGLGKDTPNGRPVDPRPSPTAEIVSLPRVGGIHHRYEWREAA